MFPCQFCGVPAALVHVHGHYQCSVCGTNALPCCDGDNCDTNLQWANAEESLDVKENVNPSNTCSSQACEKN